MGITLEGNQAFFRKIKNFSKDTEQIVHEELTVALDNIYNESLRKAPADMGGGGGIRGSAYKDQKGLDGEVGYRNEYAPYIEFGTGSQVDIPQGLEEYAMNFYVSGKGRLPASPYLFPSWYKETVEFLKRLRSQIDKNWRINT